MAGSGEPGDIADAKVPTVNITAAKRLDMSQVRIDVLQDDGQWHLHTDFEQWMHTSDSVAQSTDLSPSTLAAASNTESIIGSENQALPESTGTEPDQFQSFIGNASLEANIGDGLNEPWDFDAVLGIEQTAVARVSPDWMEPDRPDSSLQAQLLITPVIEPLSALGLPSSLGFASQWSVLLRNLPFERLEQDLKARGIDLKTAWLITAQADWRQRTWQDQVDIFQRCASQNSSILRLSLPFGPDVMSNRLMSSLQHLLPDIPRVNNSHGYGSVISEVEAFRTNLNRKLVYSILNGCAGLEDLSMDCVLKHLTHYRHTSSLLLQYLQNNQSHAVKALAENLFRAAIEAQNEIVLRVILETKAIDLHNTICRISDQMHTPIGRAAYLGSLRIVQLLRQSGAKLTGPSSVSGNDPLADLVDGLDFRLQSAADPSIADTADVVSIAQELLRAGCKSTTKVIEGVLSIFEQHSARRKLQCHPGDMIWRLRNDLTSIITRDLAQHSHAEFLSLGFLSRITEILDDSQAAAVMDDITQVCQREHSGSCFTIAVSKLSWALVVASKQGKLQLVRLLLPYSAHLHRALSAAIRSGNVDVIDAILARGPDLVAPAHNIDEDEFDGKHAAAIRTVSRRDKRVTSFSEAITNGNDRLYGMILEAGYLGCLDQGKRFATAISAAAKTRDLRLMRNLLDHYHHPYSSDMSRALFHSLENDDEEAAMLLLDSGAFLNSWDPEGPEWRLMLDALSKRKAHLLRALLDASQSTPAFLTFAGPDYQKPIFEEAVKWGDTAVLADLLRTFPAVPLMRDELVEAWRNNDQRMIDFLLGSKRLHRHAITRCLKYAMSNGSREMIQHIVSLGADPADRHVLESATMEHPSMLGAILEQIPSARSFPDPRSGQAALNAAIQRGTRGWEQVQCLIRSPIVDVWNVVFGDLDDHLGINPEHKTGIYSPVGLAIRECLQSHKGNTDIVKSLIAEEGDPDSIAYTEIPTRPDFQEHLFIINQTALLLAIEAKSLELVKLVLRRGADINKAATCRVIRTPLQKACEVGNLEVVKHLLENSADPNGRPASCQGATALQLAAISGNCRIAAELLEHGADLYQQPPKADGRWPLEGAAEYGRMDMIKYLWKVKLTLSGEGFDEEMCKYAMKYAESRGYVACKNFIEDLMVNGLPVIEEMSVDNLFGALE